MYYNVKHMERSNADLLPPVEIQFGEQVVAPRAHEVSYIEQLSPVASRLMGDMGSGLTAFSPGMLLLYVILLVKKRLQNRAQ